MFNFFKEIKDSLEGKNLILDSFNIVNISGNVLYVEGHLGLVTLSKTQISFKVKGGVVMVDGDNMTLAELSENTIKVCGKIKKVEQI